MCRDILTPSAACAALAILLLIAHPNAARASGPAESSHSWPPHSPGSSLASAPNPNPPSAPVKLIFIHHSTGEDWLSDERGQLGMALRDSNYFVSDTNYDWGPADADVGSGRIGDHTDIGHWYNWFSGPRRDTYLDALYLESGQHCSYSRLMSDPGGPNQIVMFKSCFPNSALTGDPNVPPGPIGSNPLRGQDAGSEAQTVANAKGIYIELLNYFATRQDKLFVVVTAPPLVRGDTDAAAAANARAFNNWLIGGWLSAYPHRNVAVFDFYNVLTSNGGSTRTNDPNTNDLGWADGNHHRWHSGAVQHMRTIDNNTSAYASSPGDSHPTGAGGRKASGEFTSLLNVAYHAWKGDSGVCTISCAANVPSSAQANAPVAFAGSSETNNCAGGVTYEWDFGDGSARSNQQNASHSYAAAGTFTWTLTAAVGSVRCTRTGTIGITSAPGCVLTCTGAVPASGQANASMSFAATSSASGCTGSVTYDWDFGDGSAHSSQQNAGHTYTAAGTYSWALTAAVGGTTCRKTGTVTISSGSTECPRRPAMTGLEVRQPPAASEPPARIPYVDPVYGTCVVRVTDRDRDLDPGDRSPGLKNEYSRVQSFNADESRILVRGIDATWYLYDAGTLRPVGILPFSGQVDPRWDASNPDLLYYSEGTRLVRHNIRTSEESLVHDFAADFPGQSLAAVWTRSEGSPSLDGRYWGLMAEDQDWHVVAFLTYDQQADRVIARRDVRGIPDVDEVDSVTISPLGSYFVAQFEPCAPGIPGSDAAPCGLMVYNRDLTGGRSLLRIIGHSDLVLDAQGREAMIFQDIDTDHIATIDLASGAVTDLLPIDFSHTAIGLHFSGRANLLPGWALVSTHDADAGSHTWMDDQVLALELKAGGRVFRLAHTHSVVDPDQEHDYWAEPHASANRDMTRILFTTNWGRSGTGEVEMFLIDLPRGWSAAQPSIDTTGSVVFPRLKTASGSGTGPDDSQYTGFAVANLGSAAATLDFAAFDASGELISGPNVRNPSSLVLAPGNQIAKIDYEIFGSGLPAQNPIGWVALASSVRQIAGFFLTFNGSLTVLDGAAVSSATATSLVLPEIEDLGVTEIHAVNPNPSPLAVTFELRGRDGNLKTPAATRTLNARGAIAVAVASLFPGVAVAASDYVSLSAGSGVVAYEHLGRSGIYVEGLNGQDAAGGSPALYSPQYAVGGAWRSTITVVNVDSVGGTVTFRLIGDDGVQIGGARTEAIAARGKIHVADQKYFADPGGGLIQGYVEIVSSGPKLAGSVVFGDPGRERFSASLPLVSSPRNSMIFSHVASDSTYFTGIAILNLGQMPAAVSVDVFERSGRLIASVSETIPPGKRRSQLLTQYFPGLAEQQIGSGYIRITADRGVAGFALFGTHDLSVLAAVPPQAIP